MVNFRPGGPRETIVAAQLRTALRRLLKPALHPRFPITFNAAGWPQWPSPP